MKMARFPAVVTLALRNYALTYCEKHKVLLVVLPDAVINPGAVVVHFPYAAFAHTDQGNKKKKRKKRKASLAWRTMKFKTSGKLLEQQGQISCNIPTFLDNMVHIQGFSQKI